MDRRRINAHRPVSSEEVQLWSSAASSLSSLMEIYSNPTTIETIGRVNRLISAWPTDDQLPAEGLDGLKTVYKKLSTALHDVKHVVDQEVHAIDEAIERIGILIALRSASETMPPDNTKRNKRPRSPAVTAAAASAAANASTGRGVSITLPPRGSGGSMSSIPFSREPKARREALGKQLPLQEGRKVAFHPPAGEEENSWILAVVTKCINMDKNRYEVQDAEPQEDGQPGKRYNTTLRAIIPLPDPDATPSSAAHLDAYPEFPKGSVVMALYPDTSCFYRAQVLASPTDLQPSGRKAAMTSKYVPTYKVKFEDDDDQEHSVSAMWVVEYASTN